MNSVSGVFVRHAGTFDPFSPPDLQARYGSRGHYVQLVEDAAKELRKQGYILQEDFENYVEEAAHQPL